MRSDAPSHSRRSKSPGSFRRVNATAERAADDRPLVLFGASMGGMLAYEAAARTRQAVVATCLLDPRDPGARPPGSASPAESPGAECARPVRRAGARPHPLAGRHEQHEQPARPVPAVCHRSARRWCAGADRVPGQLPALRAHPARGVRRGPRCCWRIPPRTAGPHPRSAFASSTASVAPSRWSCSTAADTSPSRNQG
ncbi:MAG: alpha/beta fold hydrolase [Actinophytocola sp.]|nr:alpha/beta fold hydrolase [Actinophytocola sp.]